MFKNSHLAGVLNFRGGSVPSIGGTVTLEAALADVARCERALEAARLVAKSTARREGKSVRNLFSDGAFVARSSAEKWCDEARREGWSAGHRFLSEALSRSVSTEALDPKSPFRHLAARLERNRAEGVTMADLARLRDKMETSGAFAAMQAGDHQLAAEICAEIHREERTGKVTSERILKAAKDRRMGGPEVPPPPEGSFAQRVAAAAKKARRPTGDE